MPMEFKRNRMKQQTPEVALKTCWDGSVIPENRTCPLKPLNYKGFDNKSRVALSESERLRLSPKYGIDNKSRQAK